MNLIYMCVFFQEKYIDLLELLVESIHARGCVNPETTDLLLLTSAEFQPLIEGRLARFGFQFRFHLIEANSVLEAASAKIAVFSYSEISTYDKILYLDTDILINGDLNPIFDTPIVSNKIYAIREGRIGHECWGGSTIFTFTPEVREPSRFSIQKSAAGGLSVSRPTRATPASRFEPNTPAFGTGVMYFCNTPAIRSLFRDARLHINEYVYAKKKKTPSCLEQPFVVYHAFVQSAYDNVLMDTFMENSPADTSNNKIIYHFPTTPGQYSSKLLLMRAFWDTMKKQDSSTAPSQS
jgi:Glycosyl transferase family 8